MARKKAGAGAAATEALKDLQATFGPIGAEPQQDDKQGGAEPDLAGQLRALNDQFGTLKSELGESRKREERLQNLYMQLLAAGPQQQPVQQSQPAPAGGGAGIDFDSLPDPSQDLDGFRKGLQKQFQQIATTVTAAQAGTSDRAQREQRLRDLWTRFNGTYKDLADEADLVELEAGKIIKNISASGVDAERYIFADPDAFMERVATGVRTRLQKYKGTEGDEEGDEGEEDTSGAQAADPGRTAGIPGGTPTSGGGKKPVQTTSTFIDELKQVQKELRIF